MLTEKIHFRTDKQTRRLLIRIAKLHQRKFGDMLRILIAREAARLDRQTPGNGELTPVQPVAATEERNVGMVMPGDTV